MTEQALEELRGAITGEAGNCARVLAGLRRAVSDRFRAGMGDEEAAALHSFRGIVHALLGDDLAAAVDFWIASKKMPAWPGPLYNLGVLAKNGRKWGEAQQAYTSALLLAKTLRGPLAAYARCGLDLAAVMGNFEGELPQTSIAQLVLEVPNPSGPERVWAEARNAAVATVKSIPSPGSPCGYADLVAFDVAAPYAHGIGEELVGCAGPDLFVRVLRDAGYKTYGISGPDVDAHLACDLVQAADRRGLRTEVWSFTRSADPSATAERRPLRAGVAVMAGDAEAAVAALEQVSREKNLPLFFPGLKLAAGDELGAARHRKYARHLALAV